MLPRAPPLPLAPFARCCYEMLTHFCRAQLVRLAICIGMCVFMAACASFKRFADRQQRYCRYTRALRHLPDHATRADIYAALPPLRPPAPPFDFAIIGVGAMATECYPLDADYQVVVTFLYARSRFIYDEKMTHFHRLHRFTRSVQTPRDEIFPTKPTIGHRDSNAFPAVAGRQL
jgi:hypothetical protein